ncbi:DNA-3-methyladenine glycosylase 2 family protein [Patescibacteria group bacterium]|nr:DNA-3-methyladenine glycosylase 2 family protein [Patescibacteria group bacterium]MCL5091411.1 DNA-3-methyladenine glycosylase 2 family protein [Patescibacteria group bacterium]
MDKQALDHFKTRDPVLHRLALRVGKLEAIQRERPQRYFARLCREIICQQLSGKAGDTIFGRFVKLFPASLIRPSDVMNLSHDQLRAVGMSHAKADYLRHLAEAIVQRRLKINQYEAMDDQAIVADLIMVKGIGQWTAEMFLMFVMGRPDVFSYGDLGLRKAIFKLYRLKPGRSAKQMQLIVDRWSPHKTYAARLLWASLEP